MSHHEKVAAYIAELESRGVRKSAAAPPLFVLAWKLGFEVPPPFFLGFGSLLVIMGLPFGIFWGGFMWFFMWQRQGMPLSQAALLSGCAGVPFGIAMAGYCRWKARKLGLGAWKDYAPKV